MNLYWIIIVIIASFAGYAVGRLGHVTNNKRRYRPHHWIYGLLLILLGSLIHFHNIFIVVSMISFGFGCFISDLYDFLDFKIIAPDSLRKKKSFFGFD
jgi:hypothetical protein